ncbi:SDR family oxidoreductase [Leptothermofonsia sp. ETS-13]|uniref:SDR family oxidoreductase n=1 Tax=Leptothermofonsia sp. ETS-13 TaxID=3035696 RepID=UPI003BA182F6
MLNLTGKNALVTGIANNRSIAWGIAQQLHKAGANIGVTYLPDEERRVKKLAELVEPVQPSLFLPCNVQHDAQIQATFDAVKDKWGRLDILIHCLAFANKEDLSGSFVNTSREGFAAALDISAYSLIKLCAAAQPPNDRRGQRSYPDLPGGSESNSQLQRDGNCQGCSGDECTLSRL